MQRKMSERKTRVWLTSLAVGCVISCLLTAAMEKTHYGFWLPGVQLGWLFAWATGLVRPAAGSSGPFGIALVTLGNAAFYAWFSSRVLRAEILAGGSMSRYFLR
jgi:uncharacterized membrane protein